MGGRRGRNCAAPIQGKLLGKLALPLLLAGAQKTRTDTHQHVYVMTPKYWAGVSGGGSLF